MNERIRQLAEQACFDEVGKDYSLYFNLTKDKVNKFAELIIKECEEILQEEKKSPEYSDFYHQVQAGISVSIAVIKNHFGVK